MLSQPAVSPLVLKHCFLVLQFVCHICLLPFIYMVRSLAETDSCIQRTLAMTTNSVITIINLID